MSETLPSIRPVSVKTASGWEVLSSPKSWKRFIIRMSAEMAQRVSLPKARTRVFFSPLLPFFCSRQVSLAM